MCGRFVMLTLEELEDIVAAAQARIDAASSAAGAADAAALHGALALPVDAGERRQAYPGSAIPCIGPVAPGASELGLFESMWGFEAEWSKRPVFNARIESILGGSAMWREAARDGRCIVPAASFFEPHASETMASPRSGKPMKRPYRFSSPDGAALLLAGVQADGRCSIVTTEPNRWVSHVHPRMPLVLRFEEIGAWFGPDWRDLADRGAVELAAAPEFSGDPRALASPAAPAGSNQLSLF